ncbi:MAG: beta-ketothiolase BktB [Solirubrobacteraceae bacterium]
MTNVVISSAARTAIGSFGKSLKDVSPSDLGATAARAAMERAGLQPSQIEHVVMGNVIHTEPGDMYFGRVVGIKAGIPKESPGLTVNRLCGSGLQAVVSATQLIQCGEVEVALAGGAESMSRGAYWVENARWGVRMNNGSLTDSVVGALTDPFSKVHMGITAENLSKSHSITREDQDKLAFESHQRAVAARDAGIFKDEIVPVEIASRKGTVIFEVDEHPRADITMESLSKLKPAFDKEGTVTAGNASGINDAGAAVTVLSVDKAEKLGVPVRARILGYGVAGVDPQTMGIGPVPAVRKALERAGKTLDDVDVFELNEAFAAQALAVLKDLGLDTERVNPNGGAIALGHPVGASGALILTKLLYEMERKDHKIGVAGLCIGGGQGIAIVVSRD